MVSRRNIIEPYHLVLDWGPQSGEDAPFIQRLWPAVLAGARDGNGLKVTPEMLDNLLTACARDCLNSRKRRDELVQAFTPMLEASADVQTATGDFLEAVLQYHVQHYESNGGVCRLGKFHNILYVGASIAVEQNLQNADVIRELMETLYRCENGLDRLVTPALLGPKVSHLLSSWKPDTDSSEEARHRLQYFIDHARTSRLTFPQPGGNTTRLVDTPLATLQGASPLYVAAQAGDEDAVLLLLQNGATPLLGGELCPFKVALRRLSAHARATIGQMTPCDCPGQLCPCFFSYPIDYPPDALGVLRLLLSALGGWKLEWDTEVVHPRILCDKILSDEPPSLKHWARYRIRSELSSHWALPHGTRMLGLPESLVQYVDLNAN
ncbi:uncharacterized protein [Palaemon carinicauda]|uniref:uncharacterized protein n=1 Tax=Palaemon carinicauda TaxID=392227 RepID=UPI0035B57912